MYSESTSELMDTEVRAIVDEAYKRTIALMIEKKEQVGCDFLFVYNFYMAVVV